MSFSQNYQYPFTCKNFSPLLDLQPADRRRGHIFASNDDIVFNARPRRQRQRPQPAVPDMSGRQRRPRPTTGSPGSSPAGRSTPGATAPSSPARSSSATAAVRLRPPPRPDDQRPGGRDGRRGDLRLRLQHRHPRRRPSTGPASPPGPTGRPAPLARSRCPTPRSARSAAGSAT